jgi:hypothetical protein
MRRMIWLQTPTVFWQGGGTIYLSCSMYMGLVMLGRQKYTPQNHYVNMSTTDHIVSISPILEKKWEYYEAVHKLFIDFNKAYDSVRREVL